MTKSPFSKKENNFVRGCFSFVFAYNVEEVCTNKKVGMVQHHKILQFYIGTYKSPYKKNKENMEEYKFRRA